MAGRTAAMKKVSADEGFARPQRITDVVDPSTIKLAPGQYLIRTPQHFNKDRFGQDIETQPIFYNGTAYGVKFDNNAAIIDDESVREIREVMLRELEDDETKLPPWFRAEEGDAAALARKLQSDFGYEVHPPLPKLRKLTRAQIAASMPDEKPEDVLLFEQTATAKPGEDTVEATPVRKRIAPVTGRTVAGVDAEDETHPKGIVELTEEMEARAAEAGKPGPAKPSKRRLHRKG